MKIAVIGAGSWGTAIAGMLGQKHDNVVLWARNSALIEKMTMSRENAAYLPGVKLADTVNFTDDLCAAAAGAELVILVTPSHGLRETASRLASILAKETIIVTATKGLEIGTLKRMSEVVAEEIPFLANKIAALSGPNHAEEVGFKQPSATVVASPWRKVAEIVQDAFISSYFRVYTNPDIVGVELGGALKNIIALGAGACEGLGFGDNAKSALITRGLAEITRLGMAMAAKPLTFAGLSGIGDLIVTCTSCHSRNHRAGLLLAEGKTVEEIQSATNMVVEGIRSTMAAYELAKRYGVEMPITQEIYRVLYENADPKEAVSQLMSRGRTHENEEVAIIDNWL
ncbi:MAG: hypothetical protein H6Q73_1124 [Firmicutes bacterium]|nr:hypothetical protein [Bacillota bacterium]